MKSHFNFVFILLIISMFHRMVHSEVSREHAFKMCASELGITEDIMKEILSPDDMKPQDNQLKSVVMCLLRVYGMVNDKGELMKDVIINKILQAGGTNKHKEIVLLESCIERAGTPGPSASWFIIMCVSKHNRM